MPFQEHLICKPANQSCQLTAISSAVYTGCKPRSDSFCRERHLRLKREWFSSCRGHQSLSEGSSKLSRLTPHPESWLRGSGVVILSIHTANHFSEGGVRMLLVRGPHRETRHSKWPRPRVINVSERKQCLAPVV